MPTLNPKTENRVVNLFAGSTVASIGEHLIHDHNDIAAVAVIVLYKDGDIEPMFTEMPNADLALLSKAFEYHVQYELFA